VDTGGHCLADGTTYFPFLVRRSSWSRPGPPRPRQPSTLRSRGAGTSCPCRRPPGELGNRLRCLVGRIAGEAEAEALAGETERWISDHLGPGYGCPGHVRELEPCVRNVTIRGESRPRGHRAESDDDLGAAIAAGSLTAGELIRRYGTIVFARGGNYLETARRLGLDRRTVKDRVDPALLARLRARPGG
jgi:hypothetical protein